MNATQFNLTTAEIFRRCAEVLRRQDANPFRVNAYLHAAETLETRREDVRDILAKEGIPGLIALPGIGRGLAAAIDEIARTGRLSRLDRLRGETRPEVLFQTVPGIGPQLARELHETLHVDTLEALEVAAHDGRLASVSGIGERRAAGIRAGLGALLSRGSVQVSPKRAVPPVSVLLDVDRAYRQQSAAGKLPKIAPKRFNPEGQAWLPIMHTSRGQWHFTVLFSNTARAHELGRTDDWVVIYYYDDDHDEGQNTVVTETKGPLTGRRVIRGREAECRALTASAD
jgi:hypothetical protein